MPAVERPLVRVVRVRCRFGVLLTPCVYVGRPMPRQGLAGHVLCNPYRLGPQAGLAERQRCLRKYNVLIAALPGTGELLERLREELEQRGLSTLGCWCGTWSPGGPELLCHAVTLARLLNGEVLGADGEFFKEDCCVE
jgi:hypothetical protein